jgi:hypothetical protein
MSVLLCTLAAGRASAADDAAKAANPDLGFRVRPALLDTSDGTGSTIGLEFEAHEVPFSGKGHDLFSPTGRIGDTIVGKPELKFDATGTVTADAKRNPKDLLDGDLTGSYVLTTNSYGAFKLGGFGKYETDQSFDNKQFVYGLRSTYVKIGLLTQFGDWVALRAARGQVDPKGDKDRETALGTSDVPKYYRNEFEFAYHVDVRWNISSELKIVSVELDYLYFLESSAPAQVEAAGLDRHHLATVRLNFANNLYIGYGKGRLPFDKQNDSIYEIGLHYKLQ